MPADADAFPVRLADVNRNILSSKYELKRHIKLDDITFSEQNFPREKLIYSENKIRIFQKAANFLH